MKVTFEGPGNSQPPITVEVDAVPTEGDWVEICDGIDDVMVLNGVVKKVLHSIFPGRHYILVRLK